MKVLWFDCETTGLDPKINDIITASFLIEIDGEIVDRLDIQMQPRDYAAISPKALETNGLTIEQIKTFPPQKEGYEKIEAFMSKHVDKFKKNKTSEDKLIPAGYNVLFDVNFLVELFKKNGNVFIGGLIDYHKIDVASIVLFCKLYKIINITGYKLVEVAKDLEISMDNAHDAGCDIQTTRIVAQKLSARLNLGGATA
jgi:DNA polymerase III alpha subunit (gram-positive type)